VGCIVLLVLFAFSQFISIGNYNFITPYSHECTHGIALSLLGIWCLGIYLERKTLLPVAVAGLALGLVFLTSVEMFVALCFALVVGLVLTIAREEFPMRRLAVIATFLGCAFLPVVLGVALLCLKIPPHAALAGITSSW